MIDKTMKYNNLSSESRRVYVDMQQIYEQSLDASEKLAKYSGSMVWKKSNGKEYLYRIRNRRGHGKSLGPRSEKTESIHAQFISEKKDAEERQQALKSEIDRQAKFCVAAEVGRVPEIAAKVRRVLQNEKGFDELIIVGTHALYAYEMMAGVRIDSDMLATGDMDLLWDSRKKIIMAADMHANGILSLLKKADKSFARLDNKHYAAANKKGFLIELVKPLPNPPMKVEPLSIGNEKDLCAAEMEGLDWLVSQRKVEVVVISENGFPVKWLVPDPRVYAIHKLWLAKRDDRDPIKKERDQQQGLLVMDIINDYLQGYPFNGEFKRNLPSELNLVLDEVVLK
jgi:hypothetical protein